MLYAEGYFLGEVLGVLFVLGFAAMLIGLSRDIWVAAIGSIRVIANRRANPKQRKQEAMKALGWIGWVLGIVTALYGHPAWLTFFLIGFALHVIAYFNGRRMREQHRARQQARATMPEGL